MSKSPRRRSGNRVSHGLVALGSAAVLTVYTAGYERTKSAAERLDAAERSRPVVPAPRLEPAPPLAPTPRVEPPTAASPHSDAPIAVPHDAVPHETHAKSHEHNAALRTPAPASSASPKAPTPAAATSEALAVTPAAVESTPTPSPTPTPAPAASAASKWIDGSFSGWGRSRHGDIQATVAIENGKIVYVAISVCATRYPCDVIAKLPGQVLERQSPETDFVAGATESTNAFYYAVVEALKRATK